MLAAVSLMSFCSETSIGDNYRFIVASIIKIISRKRSLYYIVFNRCNCYSKISVGIIRRVVNCIISFARLPLIKEIVSNYRIGAASVYCFIGARYKAAINLDSNIKIYAVVFGTCRKKEVRF